MLIRKSERHRGRGGAAAAAQEANSNKDMDRRTFLKRSGLAVGTLAMLGNLPLGSLRKAEAGPPAPAGATVATRKNVCTHCSVGCSVIAEVANGVWIGQEPDYDSPINRGSHCCKGAAVRDDVLSERRLRYPVKLVNGQWVRLSWEQAIDEIGDKLLEIREKCGPGIGLLARFGQVHQRSRLSQPQAGSLLGNQQFRSSGAYLPFHHRHGRRQYLGLRRDDQQLQRHSQSKTILIMGGNPAEAHPVSLQHILEGKELNRANMIVIDPRMTRTAAHATEYVRVRPGYPYRDDLRHALAYF